MARWALARVIGDGRAAAWPWTRATGPYRPAGVEYGAERGLVATGADGLPALGWGLVRFPDDADLAAADADPDIRLLPAWTAGHVITSAQAAAIADILDGYGITGYPDPTGRTVRQVLRWVADRIDATWSVEW